MARRDRRPNARLDQPRVPGRSLRPAVDADFFGSLSERVARFLGTGRYLAYQSLAIAAWLLWNVFAPKALRFDPYTFTFLTLLLSLQAAYAAPLILLAQNRQDDRDRVNMGQDREQNSRLLADAEYLTREVASLRVSLGEVVTRDYLRAELRGFLDELDSADQADEEGRGDRSGKRSDKPRDAQRTDKQRADKQRAEKARSERSRSEKVRTDKPRTDRNRTERSRTDVARSERAHADRVRNERALADRRGSSAPGTGSSGAASSGTASPGTASPGVGAPDAGVPSAAVTAPENAPSGASDRPDA